MDIINPKLSFNVMDYIPDLSSENHPYYETFQNQYMYCSTPKSSCQYHPDPLISPASSGISSLLGSPAMSSDNASRFQTSHDLTRSAADTSTNDSLYGSLLSASDVSSPEIPKLSKTAGTITRSANQMNCSPPSDKHLLLNTKENDCVVCPNRNAMDFHNQGELARLKSIYFPHTSVKNEISIHYKVHKKCPRFTTSNTQPSSLITPEIKHILESIRIPSEHMYKSKVAKQGRSQGTRACCQKATVHYLGDSLPQDIKRTGEDMEMMDLQAHFIQTEPLEQVHLHQIHPHVIPTATDKLNPTKAPCSQRVRYRPY